ncbi:MAG TPA: alanine--glyoxylate aminotransferase family protein [Candidatus Saccharimonadales bacterium]|jgi:aspartate aminotransferase-like enzyme|nr:alanine--glyoxylate aminotransferase family protein [Candidatus Saccharimonadales bacterium]
MPGIIKERLFTPGPTPLLLEAQMRALTMTLHHRTDAFRTLMKETLDGLKYYFNTKNDVIVFSSSGTGAMEGSISNLLSPGERVLIGTAGKFGERWVELAKAYGIESVVVEAPYGHPVPVDQMTKHLQSSGPFRAVLIQATESSTGVRNDVETLGKAVATMPDTCFVVDAITGTGTTDLRPDEWGIDIMIGGSQKATMIPPGLSFASVSEKALKTIEKSKLPRYYFDYAKERKGLAKGESSYTPATSLIVCLHGVLNYIKQLGRENLIANAALLAEATRESSAALGLSNFAVSSPANAVTSINAPAGIESTKIVKDLFTRFGVILTDGQGSMKGKMFRIAHLGYYDFLDLVAVLGALEVSLLKVGHKVELGSGVRAAQNVFLRHSS